MAHFIILLKAYFSIQKYIGKVYTEGLFVTQMCNK